MTFSVPVAASQGVGVSSFVDTTSGISIIGRRVEVPVKDDTGNLLLRLVGRLQDVLRGPPGGGAATGTFERLEVQTEERQQDLSADDPEVGTLAVAVTGDLINLPPDATMEVVVKKRLSPEDRTRVEEATRSEATAMVVADEAGVVTVNTTGLVNDDITEVTLKMTVSLRWASSFGVKNIRMAHVDSDGNVEILVLECEVNFLTIEAVCIARTTRGFSEISLLLLKPESADFALSGFTITPEAVEPGKTVKVSVDVVNQGIAEASFSSILKLKREDVLGAEFESIDTESLTLARGETGTITYFVRQAEQGRYRVGIEGARGDFVQGTFDVFSELRPEDLTLSDLRVVRKDTSERVPDGGTVRPTQELGISMNIANTSSDPGRTVIALRLNGALIQIKSVFVSAAGSAEISFDFTPPVEGTYRLELLELTETVPPLGITINAAVLPADLVFVEPLRVTPAEVFGGAQITVAGQVANVGEEEGTTSVEVLLNGQVAGSLDVTVAGGDTAPFTFRLTAPEALGDHAVRVRSDDVILDLEGSFTVVPKAVEEEGMVLITDVVLEPRVVFIDAQVTATVILENSSEAVATNPRTIVVSLAGTVVGSATVTLPAGAEGVTREFTFIAPETAGDFVVEVDGVTRDLTVIEPPGAVIRIVDLAISPSEVEVGNPVTVTATVVNEGDADDSTDVILLVRGQEIQRKLTLVRAGATVDVSFDPVIRDKAGVYAVVVEVVKAEAPRTLGGSFTVTEKPKPPVEVGPDLVLVPDSLLLDKDKVKKGEAVQVSVVVFNEGDATGTETYTLRLDGEEVATEEVTLDAGMAVTITFNIVTRDRGVHLVQVDGLEAEFLVTRPAPLGATIPLIAIFGLLVAALAALLYAQSRRRA